MMFFFFNDTATTEIYTLSLHDALPIYPDFRALQGMPEGAARQRLRERLAVHFVQRRPADIAEWRDAGSVFSDRETGEDRKSTRLNSSHAHISYAAFCLKKKKKHTRTHI